MILLKRWMEMLWTIVSCTLFETKLRILVFALFILICISCKIRNHPQSTQTTPKAQKPPTNYQQTSQATHKSPLNQPNYPQTSQISNKRPTNQPKIALRFPWRHFLWTATFPSPFPCKKKNEYIFYVCATFHILSSPLHNSLSSLTADYNPSHKLSTQLWTLTNISWRLGLTMLHWKFCGC